MSDYMREKLLRKKAEEERERQAAELRKAGEQAARDHGPVLWRHLYEAVLGDLEAFNRAVEEDEQFSIDGQSAYALAASRKRIFPHMELRLRLNAEEPAVEFATAYQHDADTEEESDGDKIKIHVDSGGAPHFLYKGNILTTGDIIALLFDRILRF